MNNPRQMSQLYVCFFFMAKNPTKMLLFIRNVFFAETKRPSRESGTGALAHQKLTGRRTPSQVRL